ncbi:peroxiredoxin [Brevibacillus formosus]|uniref:thioredoxin-dependent peroxiredoxin n=1 Tax=Brevibacillus formosus TaxID=54913 RepID=A0A220MDB7_9BACL|nr:redoxin domain-containing protein [Brevibacillus formosus]ASJ52976.1 peroxiredoxin [Brevibacillus formosus]
MLKVGTAAPVFQANSTKGIVDLQAYIGKENIVLIFYPGDDTPICTKQLCAVQDHYANIEQANTAVFGVNPGGMDKKRSFAEKFRYEFPLIMDEDESIRKAYDVGKVLGLFFQQRIVYIIGKNGTILYAKKGNPPVSELLHVIENQA